MGTDKLLTEMFHHWWWNEIKFQSEAERLIFECVAREVFKAAYKAGFERGVICGAPYG